MAAQQNTIVTLRKNPYLIKCEPVKDINSCSNLKVGKVQEFARTCGVDINKDNKRKKKEELCADLTEKYAEEAQKDEIVAEKLRKELNRTYFTMYFVNDYEKSNILKKFFFGEKLKKLDQNKKDFIDLYISVYGDIDYANTAENNYDIINALYFFGQAVRKLNLLVELDRMIPTNSDFEKARADLISNISRMIKEYTQKIITLIILLKEGGHSEKYLKYLEDHKFEVSEFHEFTLYGEDIYAKVVRVHDGDTFTAVLQVNNAFYKWNVRTYGYDSYEIKSVNPEKKNRAEVAQQTLENLILNKVIMLRPLAKTDKYGRILSNVYMYKKDLPANFSTKPLYTEILTGLDEIVDPNLPPILVPTLVIDPLPKKKLSKKKDVIVLPAKIPVTNFKDLLKEYYLDDNDNMVYINQLMLDLGLAIPYEGGHKEL